MQLFLCSQYYRYVHPKFADGEKGLDYFWWNYATWFCLSLSCYWKWNIPMSGWTLLICKELSMQTRLLSSSNWVPAWCLASWSQGTLDWAGGCSCAQTLLLRDLCVSVQLGRRRGRCLALKQAFLCFCKQQPAKSAPRDSSLARV